MDQADIESPEIPAMIHSIPALLAVIARARASLPSFQPSADRGDDSDDDDPQDDDAEVKGPTSHSPRGHVINFQDLDRQMEKLEKDLKYISFAMDRLRLLESTVGTQFQSLQDQAAVLGQIVDRIPAQERFGFPGHLLEARVRAMGDMALKVKLQIPSQEVATGLAHRRVGRGGGADARHLLDKMLQLHAGGGIRGCCVFEEVLQGYEGLGEGMDELRGLRLRLCLLCFAVFPEGAAVTKRMLMYWWVGEGFVGGWIDGDGELAEDVAGGILKELVRRRLVEPVVKKRRLVAFRMTTLVRASVVFIAKRVGFFDFDSAGYPTAKFVCSEEQGEEKRRSCMRACLVETDKGYSKDHLMESRDAAKIHTLINVNDPYPDLTPEWFSRMVNLHVLCLGRCDNSSNKKFSEAEELKSHTEVETLDFLLGLRNMKHLRYLSFQGVSRITAFPNTVWSLPCLRILDLNACHTLEKIPSGIVSLKSLTHLDVSECYLVDFMPKGLSSLSELQVLKGFVISDSETKNSRVLEELAGLSKLRKLSIYTGKKSFPTEQELVALHKITALKKLTIVWGGRSQAKSEYADDEGSALSSAHTGQLQRREGRGPQTSEVVYARLPEGLEKLDLQCYPVCGAPTWLSPNKLVNLKKFYIRGGNLSNLRDGRWDVEILRLKFLFGLSMDWNKLHNAFPKLIYLEKVRCPRLSFFPTDEGGIWIDKKLLSQEKLEELGLSWSLLAGRFT